MPAFTPTDNSRRSLLKKNATSTITSTPIEGDIVNYLGQQFAP